MKRIDIDKELLIFMYESASLSVYKIADRLGIPKSTVHRNLQRYGIPCRTRKDYPGSLRGRRHSESARRKMSLARKGKKLSPEHIAHVRAKVQGANNPNYGNGDKIRGDKNPNWRGGIWQGANGYRLFKSIRNEILMRDNSQCMLCHKSKVLNVHHIDYDRSNDGRSNLVTLCTICHGRTNFNRKYWRQFLSRVVV